MLCAWCGDSRGVKPVRRDGMAVRSPVPGVPLHLCYRCWGVYRESGQRRGVGTRPPDAGPITGRDITPALLRAMKR